MVAVSLGSAGIGEIFLAMSIRGSCFTWYFESISFIKSLILPAGVSGVKFSPLFLGNDRAGDAVCVSLKPSASICVDI